MDIFFEIALQTTNLLTLIFGLSGLVLAALLLFSPDRIVSVGRFFNYRINLNSIIPYLNKDIRVEPLTFRHNRLFGAGLLAASLFVLYSLGGASGAAPFSGVLWSILFDVYLLLTKFSAVAGVLLGLALITFPEKIRKIETKMNSWFDTEPVANSLDEFHDSVDVIFLRHPLLFGAVFLIASFLLTILSISNLSKN